MASQNVPCHFFSYLIMFLVHFWMRLVQNMLTINACGILLLSVLPLILCYQESTEHFTIKDAAKQAFQEKLQDKRLRMQENVQFLQHKIE